MTQPVSQRSTISKINQVNVWTTSLARAFRPSARQPIGTICIAVLLLFFSPRAVSAVGPRLAAFDVPNVLSDPQMTLYKGQTPVASNDNWENSSNLAALVQASSDTGAFALSSGGTDAVLFVTLNPGAYTVVVSGKDGATGTALVALYVVGP